MGPCCLFFGRMEARAGLYAVAVCVHLPLNAAGFVVRCFTLKEDLIDAMQSVGIGEGERSRIVRALTRSGRTLTRLTQNQAQCLSFGAMPNGNAVRTTPPLQMN